MLDSINYKKGFLIDDEVIGGITEMAEGIYSAYVSHYLTGETIAYQEFGSLEPALLFLNSMPRSWIYESVGCSTKTGGATTSKACGSGCNGCGTGGCGS